MAICYQCGKRLVDGVGREDAIAYADARVAAERLRAESAERERDALRKDAERYRWVVKNTRIMSLDMGGNHGYAPTGAFGRIKGPSLDAAIDAAIAAERENQQ